MKHKVIPTSGFKRQAKKLLQKYRSLLNELQDLELDLVDNPKKGVSLGHSVYKIRVGVKSKVKGKVSVVVCV